MGKCFTQARDLQACLACKILERAAQRLLGNVQPILFGKRGPGLRHGTGAKRKGNGHQSRSKPKPHPDPQAIRLSDFFLAAHGKTVRLSSTLSD